MQHLFEDPDLTFKDLKDIFTKLFKGKLAVSEKSDGQNLTVTWKDGKLLAARNKATLKDPMTIDQVGKLFEGRGEVRDAFVNSMKDLQNALKTLPEDQLI